MLEDVAPIGFALLGALAAGFLLFVRPAPGPALVLTSGCMALAATYGLAAAFGLAALSCGDGCTSDPTAHWSRREDAVEWVIQFWLAAAGWGCAIAAVIAARLRRSRIALALTASSVVAFAAWIVVVRTEL